MSSAKLLRTALVILTLVPPAAASPMLGIPTAPPEAGQVRHGVEVLLEGWSSFADGWVLLEMVMVMLLALGLGALIAYHPSTRRRLTTLAHFEQPKTLLMYAVVASVVALMVEVQPTMAFVIFGIGGLLRFRTDVGEAKDTGRVILVTVVGLCVGLKIFIVAVPATLIGWLLIYALERQIAGIIRVSGVSEADTHEAIRVYRNLITSAGCRVIGLQTRFVKREFSFVVRAPATLDREALQAEFDRLGPEHRGVVDWEQL